MEPNTTAPQSAQEYITLFRNVAGIVDSALNNLRASGETGHMSGIDRAAEGVEFIASLRGDSGIFQDTRPEGLVEFQREMSATEDYLRGKLLELGYTYPER